MLRKYTSNSSNNNSLFVRWFFSCHFVDSTDRLILNIQNDEICFDWLFICKGVVKTRIIIHFPAILFCTLNLIIWLDWTHVVSVIELNFLVKQLFVISQRKFEFYFLEWSYWDMVCLDYFSNSYSEIWTKTSVGSVEHVAYIHVIY